MSRADGVHSSTCLHIAEPCDRPSCSWCSCDEEPLADWERDLLNEANATATLTAQRDAARDIAVRLEGELARVREIVTAWSLGETHRDEMVLWAIRDIVGLTPAKPDNPTPWPHPDAVIAEGES